MLIQDFTNADDLIIVIEWDVQYTLAPQEGSED